MREEGKLRRTRRRRRRKRRRRIGRAKRASRRRRWRSSQRNTRWRRNKWRKKKEYPKQKNRKKRENSSKHRENQAPTLNIQLDTNLLGFPPNPQPISTVSNCCCNHHFTIDVIQLRRTVNDWPKPRETTTTCVHPSEPVSQPPTLETNAQRTHVPSQTCCKGKPATSRSIWGRPKFNYDWSYTVLTSLIPLPPP